MTDEEKIIDAEIVEDNNEQTKEEVVEQPKKEPKIWSIFAKIAFILGFVNIGLATLGSTAFAVPGIVFACLGKKASGMEGKMKCALTLSIIALCLGLILNIVYSSLFSTFFEQLLEQIKAAFE